MSNFTLKIRASVFLVTLLVSLTSGMVIGQTKISGTLTDAETKETLVGVNILVKGKVIGTISDLSGKYALSVNQEPPFTLVFSMIGYTSQEVEITNGQSKLDIQLAETTILGQEVVVSASRVEESVLQSPVSVERMDIISIRDAPQASFYDAINNMKGVEMSTQSLLFKSFNTRGFNANGNVRTVQLIDGMDNQAPGLNFSVGNIVGISELDLESVELLPGASSALYGPNAINGILLMTSKSPFLYQGLSASVKTGIMDESDRSKAATGFYNFSARYAKAISDKFAFKLNFEYLKAEDWQANDFRDQSLLNGSTIETGNTLNNPAYNGVNSYGDEGAQDISQFVPSLPVGTFVSRTGYMERDLADYGTKSIKLNAALHYRINDNIEAVLQGNLGFGTTVYTGADRYSLKNFVMGQYKAELRASNWYIRAYTTQERSGDAFAVGTAAQGINEAWKPSFDRNNIQGSWFPQYAGTYAALIGQGMESNMAHQQARNAADQGRYMPGTTEFQNALNGVTSRPIPGDQNGVGAKFVDKSNMYHFEGSYNFSEQIKFAEVVVGANYRIYDLNSNGTIFAIDENGDEFNIQEFGGYIQGSKKLINDKFKLTASARYDKNENFAGQWSPRVSGVFTQGNHNFRASYQTGFRIPTNQDQYIDLNTPQARLIGGLPFLADRYNLKTNSGYTLTNVTNYGNTVKQTAITNATNSVISDVQNGNFPNDPALIAAEVKRRVPQFVPGAAAANVDQLQPYEIKDFKPERVKSFEVGYKGIWGDKLLVDAYAYFNRFENFNGSQVLVQDATDAGLAGPNPLTGLNLIGVGPGGRKVYSMPVNRSETIKSWGWAASLDYKLPKGYTVGGNVSFNTLTNLDELAETGFQPSFNTPEYRYVVNFANREVIDNLGFAVAYRWQGEFAWQSSFVNPAVSTQQLSVIPAYGTFDAQVSYKIKSIKSILKVGGSNLFSKGYTQAWGNPTVGTMYYVSITFDEFLN